MEPWRCDQSRKFLYLLDKERMHLKKMTGQRSLDWGRKLVMYGGDQTSGRWGLFYSVCLYKPTSRLIPVSCGKNVHLFLVQGRHISQESLWPVFRQKSVRNSLHLLFLSASAWNMTRGFWGDMSWTRTRTGLEENVPSLYQEEILASYC